MHWISASLPTPGGAGDDDQQRLHVEAVKARLRQRKPSEGYCGCSPPELAGSVSFRKITCRKVRCWYTLASHQVRTPGGSCADLRISLPQLPASRLGLLAHLCRGRARTTGLSALWLGRPDAPRLPCPHDPLSEGSQLDDMSDMDDMPDIDENDPRSWGAGCADERPDRPKTSVRSSTRWWEGWRPVKTRKT